MAESPRRPLQVLLQPQHREAGQMYGFRWDVIHASGRQLVEWLISHEMRLPYTLFLGHDLGLCRDCQQGNASPHLIIRSGVPTSCSHRQDGTWVMDQIIFHNLWPREAPKIIMDNPTESPKMRAIVVEHYDYEPRPVLGEPIVRRQRIR